MEAWRIRVRQAWLAGLLHRDMNLGKGQNLIGHMVYNGFCITESGCAFINEPHPIPLPEVKKRAVPMRDNDENPQKATRQGKGCHILPTIRHLMSSSERWYEITNDEDYHFPGIFDAPYPQRMGFCPDITQLPKYDTRNPHFIYADIQFSKGIARNPRKVSMQVDGKDEMLWYRIVPCGGVKLCAKHSEGCSHVVPVREKTKCPTHPSEQLCRSEHCPVEFVYLWPEDEMDKRRWLSGISRVADMHDANLHNHPSHSASKIPSKVVTDIQQALLSNPTLKTSDLMTGEHLVH